MKAPYYLAIQDPARREQERRICQRQTRYAMLTYVGANIALVAVPQLLRALGAL